MTIDDTNTTVVPVLQILYFTVLFDIFDGEIDEIFDMLHANDDWIFRI